MIYLILKLLWPVHFSWGVGEVLWTLVEFMLHGVDGVTAEERQNERKREGEEEMCELQAGFNTFLPVWCILVANIKSILQPPGKQLMTGIYTHIVSF